MAKQWPQTCTELVEAVKDMKPRQRDRYLQAIKWLDELAGIATAAEFTGLAPNTVRTLHRRALRDRHLGIARQWSWPEPDVVLGRAPGWYLRTVVTAQATRPGRGAGGGRPWHKEVTRPGASGGQSPST